MIARTTASNDFRMYALIDLGLCLKSMSYEFTAITPESHRRVISGPRALSVASSPLRDLFGWSREVPAELVPTRVLDSLRAADALVVAGSGVRSRVRAATLGSHLFFHSAYPTIEADSVFFGPDSYRFVRYARANMPDTVETLVDIGCGAGVGGIALSDRARSIIMTDINARALELAQVNAHLNGVHAHVLESNLFAHVPKGADVVIANPPFIIDSGARAYRDGGRIYGAELSLKILDGALKYLNNNGRLILYTGACVVDGEDVFLKHARERLGGRAYKYEEIDPDIFGEELSLPAYADVERIAAVGLVVG